MQEDVERTEQPSVESIARDAEVPAGAAGAEPGRDRFRGIGQLTADHFELSFGAVGMARGRSISIGQAAVGLAAGDEVSVRQSSARLVLAREAARVEMSAVATVAANQVDVGRGTAVAVLIARHVEGDVRPLLDWRGGLALGVAFGVVATLLRPIRGSRGRRRRR